MKKGTLIAAATLALGLAGGTATTALSQDARVEVGQLHCTVEGGAGFIIGSSKDMTCRFDRVGAPSEHYVGTINKLGVDIGWTNETIIAWTVFAGTNSFADGALSGTYGGATAEATIGAGLGANALVGGIDRSFALQPLSVQAQTGLNVAGGLASLTLRHVQ
jgi:hypothetical protein